jgi:hypothetical protein
LREFRPRDAADGIRCLAEQLIATTTDPERHARDDLRSASLASSR